MSTTVIVDDTDPTIHYTGNWTLGGPVTASSNEFNRTVHIASENGLGFTYEFKGTSEYQRLFLVSNCYP